MHAFYSFNKEGAARAQQDLDLVCVLGGMQGLVLLHWSPSKSVMMMILDPLLYLNSHIHTARFVVFLFAHCTAPYRTVPYPTQNTYQSVFYFQCTCACMAML